MFGNMGFGQGGFGSGFGGGFGGGFGNRFGGGFGQQFQQRLGQGWTPGGYGQGLISPGGLFGVRPSWMQSPTIPMGSWTPGSGGVTNTVPMGMPGMGGVPPSPQSLGFTMSGGQLMPPQMQGPQQYGAYPSNPGVTPYVGGLLG